MIETCFFCERIIVPLKYVTINDVMKFFKENKMDFTLNHERSRTKIGKKIICLNCERDIKKIIDSYNKNECECENCRKEQEDEEENNER